MALDRLSFLGVDVRCDHVFLLEVVFMCVLNVKGLWCLLQRSAKSACVWFSVHAVCSCNPGCEGNNEVIRIQITRTAQPCVFYSHCTAMCVFYWVSVRDDDISSGRACDWIDSSADCDVWLTCFWALFTLTLLLWKQCLHILCLNNFWQQFYFFIFLYTGCTCFCVFVWYTLRYWML